MNMDKYFTTEIWKMLGILGLGGITLMAIVGRLVTKLRGSFAPYRKVTIIYLLCYAGLGALAGFAGHPSVFGSASVAYILFQVFFALLGAVHLYTMYRYLAWSTGNRSFWLQLLFTIVVAVFAAMSFMLVYKWMNRAGLHVVMTGSAVFVIIPLFVYHAFLAALAVPPKVFKQWYYPLHQNIPDPDAGKLKNVLVVAFQFQKTTTTIPYTSFRAKAPADMEFGQLFYYFLEDYNKRHPDGRIEFLDKRNEPYGWIFYKYPRWYTLQTKYIDPDKTFFVNKIKEDDVIVCRRVITL
jgi:Type VI secretion system, TssN